MSVLTSETGLEPGLPIDQIESRLLEAANRHHLEERNIAYWLHELDQRGLHKQRGFSSIGDYAMELIGIKPRKAQYLVFIASRLEKLPRIREAFDAGELPWTKAREIVSVATPETEAEWLEKARALSNRDLEKEVRRHAGRESGGFATVTISMPVEVLAMWNDAYELAERLCGTELEKWQVLEPSLAEFLGTHLPPGGAGAHETDDEKELPDKVRDAVLDRDMWQCKFPGCTMRKMLDVHHIEFRSHLGSEDHGNKISICRIHHGLVHRGICKITGTVGVDLKFERPQLVTEQKPAEAELVIQYQNELPEEASPEETSDEEVASPDNDDNDESSRDEIIADVFADLLNGPRPPRPETPFEDYGAFNADWPQRPLRIIQRRVRELKDRAEQRRAGQARPGAHVCAGDEQAESPAPEPIGGGPSG